MFTCGGDACLLWVVLKWTLVVSYIVCERDTLGLRLVLKIVRQEGPSLGILLEYTLENGLGSR